SGEPPGSETQPGEYAEYGGDGLVRGVIRVAGQGKAHAQRHAGLPADPAAQHPVPGDVHAGHQGPLAAVPLVEDVGAGTDVDVVVGAAVVAVPEVAAAEADRLVATDPGEQRAVERLGDPGPLGGLGHAHLGPHAALLADHEMDGAE